MLRRVGVLVKVWLFPQQPLEGAELCGHPRTEFGERAPSVNERDKKRFAAVITDVNVRPVLVDELDVRYRLAESGRGNAVRVKGGSGLR